MEKQAGEISGGGAVGSVHRLGFYVDFAIFDVVIFIVAQFKLGGEALGAEGIKDFPAVAFGDDGVIV